jgi:hypothetical protein
MQVIPAVLLDVPVALHWRYRLVHAYLDRSLLLHLE